MWPFLIQLWHLVIVWWIRVPFITILNFYHGYFYFRSIHLLLLEEAMRHWFSRSLQVQEIDSHLVHLKHFGWHRLWGCFVAGQGLSDTCERLVCVVISNYRKTLCLVIWSHAITSGLHRIGEQLIGNFGLDLVG